MLPHEQRVVDESNELRVKLAALDNFIETDLFNGLPDADKILLLNQQDVMAVYLNILRRRIIRFST